VERHVRSAVGLAAVLHAGNLDGGLVFEIEEHPVVAAAQAEAGSRRFELFHVAAAAGQVAVDTVVCSQNRIRTDQTPISVLSLLREAQGCVGSPYDFTSSGGLQPPTEIAGTIRPHTLALRRILEAISRWRLEKRVSDYAAWPQL